MCALYTINPNPRVFQFGGFSYSFSGLAWDDRIAPGRLAPVIIQNEAKLMRFSLIPSWSKEPKVKFATHNARIETVLEKPTWRKPFEKKHCLIPIDYFIEPIYESGAHVPHEDKAPERDEPLKRDLKTGDLGLAGEANRAIPDFSGCMVRFVPEQTILAAGIYDEWVNKETGEVIESFSILTKEPTAFVANIGHDRQPIFLDQDEDRAQWLLPESKTPKDWQNFLSTLKNHDEFRVEVERKLKAK